MTLADMNKWTSGETEVFFDPRQTPSAAGGDNNSGGEKLTARPSIQKIAHLAIAATIGAFASVAVVYFAVLMRGPVEPSRAASENVPATGSGILATGGRALGGIEGTRPMTASPTAMNSTLAMPILNPPTTAVPDALRATGRAERKPATPQQASQRDRPRYSVTDQAEREETARLMRNELLQRGIVAGASSGSGHSE